MHPASPRSIAVIDIGKTNAKVVLIDAMSFTQLTARGQANVVRRDGPYPHTDVEMLWSFILGSLREIGTSHAIDGISITTHGASGVLMAEDGLAMPIIDYEFDGPDQTLAQYRTVRPDFSESLSPLLPKGLNVGAQIFWQSRTFPGEFSRVTAILCHAQYWAWRLTGVLASEVTSLGCHTDLWAPGKDDFSSMVDRLGWRHLFPPLRPAASVLGNLLPEIAEATGLAPSTPVTCGIHDSNASLLPHLGRKQAPFTILSTGTWTIVMTVGGDVGRLDAERDSLANVDIHGRPVPTARFMGGREFDLLVPEIATPTADEIEMVIAGDVQALPSFVPGVGPFGDRAGRWTVDPQNLTPGQRTAAASLYLALVTRESLELCGMGRTITVEGPLARNTLFGAALTRLAGVPVFASEDGTGTSLGASLLFGGKCPPDASQPVRPLEADGLETYARRWQERARAPK